MASPPRSIKLALSLKLKFIKLPEVAPLTQVKVGDTIYVVLYTPPLGEETVKYSAGRDLLVLVGKRTIRYNDILGQSFEVPIESQKTAAKAKQSK